LLLDGFDIKGGGFGIGNLVLGSAGNSILTTNSSGNLTEKILNNGQLLIGKTGDEPQIATLTGTANRITVTNGPGSITLSTPQDLHTAANVTFGSLQVPVITTSSGNLSLNPASNIDVNSKRIINVANPINSNDATNKIYVDNAINNIYANPDFGDNVFRISDDIDASKKIAFQASSISSGATRTITMPDQNINLGLVPSAIQRDGSVAFVANQSMGLNRLTNLANPINPLDAANKSYVDSVISGLDFQKDVNDVINNPNIVGPGAGLPSAAIGQRYILTANTSSLHSSWGTISGVQDNDIVEFNGTNWVVAYDVSVQGPGALCWNINGAHWVRWSGSSWDEFGGLSGVIAGAGLDKTGHTMFIDLESTSGLEFDVPGDGGKLRVRVDNATLERHSSGLRVRASGITANELASNSVTSVKIASSAVTEPKIASNAVTGVKIASNAVTGSKIRLSNGEWLRGRNAADSVDINILRVNSTDNLEIGQSLLPTSHATFNIGDLSAVFNNFYVRTIESDVSTLTLKAGTSIDVNNKKITSLATPTASSDAVNKSYVDTTLGDYLKRDGSNTITGSINLNAANTYNFASVAFPFLEIFSNRFSVVESSTVRARLQSFTSPSSVTVYGLQSQNVPAAIATNSPPMGDSNHVYIETGNVTGTSNSGNIYLRT
ncbi:MAG: hypothetical protein NZZ41_07680, partial [Candidatus Dojkabacteria bacterium]|nr:hypothetical protein [Candidatus Dojkabacteria bacterium]